MKKTLLVIAVIVAVGGCTNNVMTAPVAVQRATAGQDNQAIVLPLAFFGAVALTGI